MIEVIDNLLPQEQWETLHDLITSDDFRWNYARSTVQTYDPMPGDTFQFVRAIYLDTDSEPGLREKIIEAGKDPYNELSRTYPEFFSIAMTALERSERTFAGIDMFLRIKANLLLPVANRPTFHPPHIDTDGENFLSVLYYLNESDGDTFLFPENEKGVTVTPKSNRAVLFDSNIKHASSNPISAERRMVINSVFLPKYS